MLHNSNIMKPINRMFNVDINVDGYLLTDVSVYVNYCEFDYSPEEKQTMYHPGYTEEIEFTNVDMEIDWEELKKSEYVEPKDLEALNKLKIMLTPVLENDWHELWDMVSPKDQENLIRSFIKELKESWKSSYDLYADMLESEDNLN